MRPGRTRSFLFLPLAVCAACRTAPMDVRQPLPLPRPTGDEIVICGQRFHTRAPVVLWSEYPGYNAYGLVPDLDKKTSATPAMKLCYTPGRESSTHGGDVLVEPGSRDIEQLRAVVDQFVLHYDVCGVSRTCSKVLQDRGLSVHFLLDIDGTIYQTLDLREQAWHATKSNPRSIGIEIAHMGAYAKESAATLAEWYAKDAAGPYIRVPDRLKGGGVRTPGFVGRPARPAIRRGRIHANEYVQYDFTPEQYDSLAKLAATVCTALPRIQPDAPRDASGRVTTVALSDDEWQRFHGILGHYHVQTNKQDPGPAFDWERFLAAVRARIAEAAPAP